MAANPSCIRAVPHDTNSTVGCESPAISLYLYMDTAGRGITNDLREEEKKNFSGYILKFVDLERELLGEYFTPRDWEDEYKAEEMAKVAQVIEKNLHVFENRLNVTAVYPSYQISNSQETDALCITVSVLGKGITPVGENEFLKTLGEYPLDIVEGYFSLTRDKTFLSKASPLHLGVGIGIRGIRGGGTLGAFLKDEEENYYLLSCQHVLFQQNQKPAKEQPTKEQSTKEQDFIAGKVKLEKLISEKRERLKKRPKEIGNVEIKRGECEVRSPEQDEILIEQPAADDFVSEMNGLEKSISKDEKCIEKLRKKHDGLYEWEKPSNLGEITVKSLQVTTSKRKLENLIKYKLPRCIATYTGGLRGNWLLPNPASNSASDPAPNSVSDPVSDSVSDPASDCKMFFVDAAIAKINTDEFSDIQSSVEKGSIYGFDEEKHIHKHGEVVAWKTIEQEANKVNFWKSGRTTRHTNSGKFCQAHFYANLKGFEKHKCHGDFTNIRFETYCQTCAPNIKFDLFETSLLKELKCSKCKAEIPKESDVSELWAYNCYLIGSKGERFSDVGDSGAVIFDEDKGHAWGIVVGYYDNGDLFYTVAIPLDIAINALNQKLGKKLQLWCKLPEVQPDKKIV